MENVKEWKYGPGVRMNADGASYKTASRMM